MKIPFQDLKQQYLFIKPEVDSVIEEVIENTSFIGGKFVKDFEKNFARTYGVKHCIGVANGTDALYITMKMLGIGQGDEVITTALSWISTSETITQAGAKPVFVDIEPELYTIDPEKVEEKINSKTKAIIPVHLYGQMCNMDRIMEIAAKYNLKVIEDCAQSHFSEFKGKRAGLYGDAATFSFYPGKNLGAYGDAGCIITEDDSLAMKMRMFANHGALKKHEHKMEGINSRLDSLQAGILDVKLRFILNWTDLRVANAKLYQKYLSDIAEVSTPSIRKDSMHSFHLYVIKLNEKRDELMKYLSEKGVSTVLHYPTILPLLEAYEYLGHTAQDFPVAFDLQQKMCSIPMFPELREEQIRYVAECIKSFYLNQKK